MSDRLGPSPGMPKHSPSECEKCFEKLTYAVQDARCVGYVLDEKTGKFWLRWDPEGKLHYFCARHTRKPREYGKDEVVARFVQDHPESVRDATPEELAERNAGQ